MRGLRARLSAKRGLLNGYLMLPSAAVAEFYARQGFDMVTVDLQHGLQDYASALSILQALGACDVLPMVRIPWLDPGLIMKLLDAGAMGVTCPMVNTAEDARRLVTYAHYPPEGERSLGPIRASAVYGESYAQEANHSIATLAMIETREGLANVEAIAATDGLTGLYIGPGDLALALGRPSYQDRFDVQVEAAVAEIVAASRRHGRFVGTFAATPERAHVLVRQGFDFVTLNTDVAALQAQAAAWVSSFRRLEAGAK
jgi:4-hydroxy-2-oxoheptanedioate aldolase